MRSQTMKTMWKTLLCTSAVALAGCYPDVPRPGEEACLAGREAHCTPEVCAAIPAASRPAACDDVTTSDVGDTVETVDAGPDTVADTPDVQDDEVTDASPDLEIADPDPDTSDTADIGDGGAEIADVEPDEITGSDTEDEDVADGDVGDAGPPDVPDVPDIGPELDVETTPDCSSLDGQCVVGVWNGTGCEAQPTPDEPCDDGDLCTEGDSCSSAGVCAGTTKDCADTSDCTTDSCDPSTGACLNEPLTEGTGCDDGDPCTVGDACDDSGLCVASPKDCADPFACTVDGCDLATGDCTHDDASCVVPTDFVEISPGTFTMGSPESELGRGDDEQQHSVSLTREFYLQTEEVTQAQWAAIIGNNPSQLSGCGSCPVEMVNWWEAVFYANALSEFHGLPKCYQLTGCTGLAGVDLTCSNASVATTGGNPYDCTGYRLPTESEWEYAYRAGTETAFYSGSIEQIGCSGNTDLQSIAWYCANSGDATHSTQQKAENAWGLYDMAGNVSEWCWDWYGPYPVTSTTDPTGPGTGLARTSRGGSWDSLANACRGADRSSGNQDTRLPKRGLRLARTKQP